MGLSHGESRLTRRPAAGTGRVQTHLVDPPSPSTTTPPARTAPARHPAPPASTGSAASLSPRIPPRSVKCPSARSWSLTAVGNGSSLASSPRGGSAWRCRCSFLWACCSTSPWSAASSAAGTRVVTGMRARSNSDRECCRAAPHPTPATSYQSTARSGTPSASSGPSCRSTSTTRVDPTRSKPSMRSLTFTDATYSVFSYTSR